MSISAQAIPQILKFCPLKPSHSQVASLPLLCFRVQGRLSSGEYSHSVLFADDVRVVFRNAAMCSHPGSDLHVRTRIHASTKPGIRCISSHLVVHSCLDKRREVWRESLRRIPNLRSS